MGILMGNDMYDGGNKMRHFNKFSLLIIFTLLLTGCTELDKEQLQSNSEMTIETLSLSDKESLLISKTGVGHIEYFRLNGTLHEDDDLQFSVELYEKGKFKQELLKTFGQIETNFKKEIISFAVIDMQDENHSLKLVSGIPSGLASTFYSNNMSAFSFGKLINEKVTLEKNKPIYLAAWLGTTQNRLRSIGDENGQLPLGIEEYELAFLYKVLLTNRKEE